MLRTNKTATYSKFFLIFALHFVLNYKSVQKIFYANTKWAMPLALAPGINVA